MGKVVLHIKKPKGNDSGTSAHIERTVMPGNADPERTHLNKEFIEFPEEVKNRTQAIQYRIEHAGIKRKVSHNQVRALQIMLSGSPEDMKHIKDKGRLDEWCKDNIDWLQDTFGKENVVSAVLHLDEKTPHIHATVVPIVKGERRKAKAEENNGKKKYRKKAKDIVRLCADDVMARDKLEHYQDTYAEKMQKYGLERGIRGSEARHISTDQYYRELTRENIHLQQGIQESIKAKESLEKEIQEQKGQLKTEKLKNDVVNTIGSLFSNTKLKKLHNEKESLECKVKHLNQEYNKQIQEKNDIIKSLKNELVKSESIFKQIEKLFPYMKEILQIDNICRTARFSSEMIRNLILGKPVKFKGDLYSAEHKRTFHTDGSTAQMKKIEKGKGKLGVFIDGVVITDWFRNKYNDLINSLNTGLKQRNTVQKKKGLSL